MADTDVLLLSATEGRRYCGTEGCNRSAVAVCSGGQAKTEQKRNEENCALIDSEITVRTVVFWVRSENCAKRLSASSCVPVRPSAWNVSALTGLFY